MKTVNLSLTLLALAFTSCNQSANNQEAQQEPQTETTEQEAVEANVEKESEKQDLPSLYAACLSDTSNAKKILCNEDLKKMVIEHDCEAFYELALKILENKKVFRIDTIRGSYLLQCAGKINNSEYMIYNDYYPDGSDFIFNIVENSDEYENVITCEKLQPGGECYNLVK